MLPSSVGTPNLRRISRSGYEALSRCRRKYYYGYLFSKTGLSSTAPAWNLIIGLGVHKGLEVILFGGSAVEAALAAKEEFEAQASSIKEKDAYTLNSISEASALVQALTIGWFYAKREAFFEQFEVVTVEKEVEVLLSSNVALMARADAVVRDKASGELFILNWKTTSSTSDWTKHWSYDIQMWTEALAVEGALGERVAGTIVEGLYKGTRKDGKYSNYLIYGYTDGNEWVPWYTAKKGWFKVRVDSPEGPGIEEWIKYLAKRHQEVLNGYFVRSLPILKNDAVVEEWLSQVVRIESEVDYVLEEGSEEDRLSFFSQSFSNWNCNGCPFLDVCFKRSDLASLILSGHLTPRVDHHPPGEGQEVEEV